jgi:hypothetical protein
MQARLFVTATAASQIPTISIKILFSVVPLRLDDYPPREIKRNHTDLTK